jgi:DNA-binding NtrC family response regulator
MAKRDTRSNGKHATQVLVVDDDTEIRRSIRWLLEDAGYRISEAENGLVALDRIRADHDPMVVLLDLMMPKVDGTGVVGIIAGDRHLSARLRVVIMTAGQRTLPIAFVELLSTLRIPIIQKPFDLDDLLEAVRRAADQLPPI